VAVGGDGRIYLLSGETSHVYVYDENREFLFSFGKKGGSSGKMSRPVGIGVDSSRARQYVVDYMRHTVLVYDREGTYLREFGGLGWGPGWFQYPSDITVDSSGRVIVADTFNNRVEVFAPIEEEQ
jgi:DNA-binding beta-propeller fold protein YncE